MIWLTTSLLITLALEVSIVTETELFSGAPGLKLSVPDTFSNRP